MKIIVNNEEEKKLIKRFLSAMHDLDMIDTLVNVDTDCQGGYLEADDSLFLQDFVASAKVEVDSSVLELYTEHHNVTGTCVICGKQTEGTVDGEDISYEDYLDMTSEEARKEWRCEDCMKGDG